VTSGGTRLDDLQDAKYVRVQLNGSNILSLVEVQVWGELPLSPAGEVQLNAENYQVGEVAEFVVRDSNAGATVDVVVASSSGESFPLTLSGSNGIYTGQVALVEGVAGSGEIQVIQGGRLEVSYTDANDGLGQSSEQLVIAGITQVFDGDASDLPQDFDGSQVIRSVINIPETGKLSEIELTLDIAHNWNADVVAVLVSPNGERITLIDQIGGNSDNFTNTTLSSTATNPITNGSAPYTGTFAPQESFDALLGQGITGDWVLEVSDVFPTADDGTLNSWSLSLQVEPRLVDLNRTVYRYDLGPDQNIFFDNTYEFVSPNESGEIYFTEPVTGIDNGASTGNGLNRDVIQKDDGPSTFEHRVENGVWEVLVTLGDDDLPLDEISLSAEGVVFEDGISRNAGQYGNEVFEVTVTDGSLSLTIEDNGGANSLWSASRIILTRTGDLPSLALNQLTVGDGTDQRSVLNQVQLEFDSPVSIADGAFTLRNRDLNQFVDTTATLDATGQIVTLTFSGNLTVGSSGRLVDGNYELVVDGSKVVSVDTSVAWDADGDGVAGGFYTYGDNEADNFFALFGDGSGDRNVNIFDLLGFRQAWRSSMGQPDFNASYDSDGNGEINIFDLLAFRQNFRKTLPFV